MAIDQRDVSSTLRFMDDRALQQYAAMHKSDPYIFPLAFQESQNRQKLRMQQQGAQGMRPQPKVADAALQQMAPQPMPETQGIGALPAQNMQGMADGGIAGYDDDANFAERSEPVVMMAGGGHVPRYQGNPQDRSLVRMPYGGDTMGTSSLEQQDLTAQAAEITDAMVAEQKTKAATIAQLEQKLAFLTNAGAPQAAEVRAQLDALKASGAPPKPTPKPADANFRRQEDPRMKPGVAATAQPLITSRAAPVADTTRRNKPAAETAPKETVTAPSAKPDTGGLDTLIDRFTRSTDLALGEQRNARAGLSSRMEQEATEYAADTKKRIKEEGDVFKGKEERLAAREKGIEGLGDKYLGLALLQAGAAMMSTPGNLGSVIGKGIAVGSERYVAGIDKINAAKDKFAEARDRLDDLRLNRDDMNKKEVRDADRAIRTARLQGQQLLVDGAGKDLEISSKNQAAIFGVAADSLKTDKTLAAGATDTDKRLKSAEDIARDDRRSADARSAAQVAATLNTPDRILFDQLMKKNGNDAVKALEAFKVAKGDKFDVRTSYADYLKAFAGKEGLTPPMSMSTYAGQFGATLPR